MVVLGQMRNNRHRLRDLITQWPLTGFAPADERLRDTQRFILRSFALTGRPPTLQILAEYLGPDSPAAATMLRELGYIQLDDGGRITVAYPFTTTPTRHRISIAGGANVHAVCPIHALGIAPMLATGTIVHSREPTSNRQILVTMTEGATRTVWEPASAVVYMQRPMNAYSSQSNGSACNAIDFFTNTKKAAAWRDAHFQGEGVIVSQAEAIRLAEETFTALLLA